MSPSPEEPVSETGAGGADAGFVVSDEFRAVAGGADAGSVVSDEARAVAAFDDAGSLISDEVRALGAGADRGGVSVPIAGVSLSVGDDVSCAFVDVRRSRLRNRRHVSELCSVAVLGPTAGFAPSASLVSTSRCPVT